MRKFFHEMHACFAELVVGVVWRGCWMAPLCTPPTTAGRAARTPQPPSIFTPLPGHPALPPLSSPLPMPPTRWPPNTVVGAA